MHYLWPDRAEQTLAQRPYALPPTVIRGPSPATVSFCVGFVNATQVVERSNCGEMPSATPCRTGGGGAPNVRSGPVIDSMEEICREATSRVTDEGTAYGRRSPEVVSALLRRALSGNWRNYLLD